MRSHAGLSLDPDRPRSSAGPQGHDHAVETPPRQLRLRKENRCLAGRAGEASGGVASAAPCLVFLA